MTDRIDRINGLTGSIAVKAPVKVATTANITLSGEQTIDSVALTADESPRQRVLVKNQTDDTENGIYDVNSGAWTRSPDFDGDRDAVNGTQVLVAEGATPFGKLYYLSATNPVDIGTDSLTFTLVPQFGYELSDDLSPQLANFLDPNGNYIGRDKGADIASADPLVIGTDGDYFDVTGTTGFSTMTVAANRHFFLQFDGALVMTHHVTNLDLPGGVHITTAAGDVGEFFSTGANTVQCVNYTRANGKPVVSSSQLNSAIDPNGHYVGMDKGADIASVSPLVIGTDGAYFDVTGTTNLAAMTVAIDRHFFLQFDGILTMTHHATTLDLPGGANITTAAGDVAEFFSTGANTVQCVNYTKADGTAIIASSSTVLATPVASTSGTSIDFISIPAGTKQITVMFSAVSTNGTSNFLIQLGDAGGVEATGYVTAYGGTASLTSTDGFIINNISGAANTTYGSVVLNLVDASTFTWTGSGNFVQDGGGNSTLAGDKSLSAELDRIRITTVNGTDAFDAGKVNIYYQ